MTDVRTFKANTMQQALELVRQELGAEAVILHTKHVTPRRMFPWKKVRPEVEVMAGLGVNVRPPAARKRAARRKAARSNRVDLPTAKRAQSQQPATPDTSSGTLAHYLKNRDSQQPSNPALASLARMADEMDSVSISSEVGTAGVNTPNSNQPHTTSEIASSTRNNEFAAKLDSLQRMIENLGRGDHISSNREIPGELFTIYTDLIDAEIEEDLARDLISRLKQQCLPAQLNDTSAAKTLLTAMVESEIRCCDPISPTPGRRKVVALVGATGVGKTTTIAKLAANFRLREGIKMGLVTVDTYRIAAVEQLRTYAEIIDLPMKVVTNPLEMRRALDELVGLDLVLIDTAGRSPRDELQIQELKSLLAEADVDEVHLVLNATASLRSLEATTEKFAAASTAMKSVIMTKLDEAAGMGTLLSIARRIPLPISYITTGQDVPDDIEAATPGRIARLVLGREKIIG